MSLTSKIRELTDEILGRLEDQRDFYLHTRRAWRFVHQSAQEGRSVGIVDRVSGQDLSASALESLAQRYVTGPLAETTFKGLSTLLEDWILGLARIWLKAYPRQLDAASSDAGGLSRSRRREEIQVPLSEILAAPDREAILAGLAERIIRDLAYERPAHWFRFLDTASIWAAPTKPGEPSSARSKPPETSWNTPEERSLGITSKNRGPPDVTPSATSSRSKRPTCLNASICSRKPSRK